MAMVIPKGSVCMKKAGICTIVILVFAALAVWIYRDVYKRQHKDNKNKRTNEKTYRRKFLWVFFE